MANRDLIAEAGADPVKSSQGQQATAAPDTRDARPQQRRVAEPSSIPSSIHEPPPSRDAVPTPSTGQSPCWVALHFPALPLMVCDFPEGLPGVVIHDAGGRQLVHAACPLAADLGVSPGMPLNAAHVLCRNLVVRLRDPLAEYRWLKRHSELLHRFTPMVSLGFWETASDVSRGRRSPGSARSNRVVTGPEDNADTLLMEVSGSLRLFGGLETVLTKVRKLFAGRLGQQYDANSGGFPPPLLAVAPAPAAALLLARNGREMVVRDPAELRSALGGIAITGADIDARLVADLGRCGLGALRDLWRLSPADLGRRFGSRLPDYLSRLAAERPEATARRELAPRFHQRMALPVDTRDSGMILLVAEKLLTAACGFLASHAAAVEEVVFDLWHVDRGQGERGRTRLGITAARAGRQPQHFLPQLETRLEILSRPLEGRQSGQKRKSRLITMPAAIEAVSIRLDRVLPYSRDSQDLFQRRQEDQPDWDGLMDLLTVRLGREGVYRLAPVADHRPERAARRRWVAEKSAVVAVEESVALRCQTLSPRPLWLLPQPRILAGGETIRFSGNQADENGVHGSERIEAGWWDRADMRRDYRMAPLRLGRGEKPRVAMGWIYRQRTTPGQINGDRVPSDRVPSDRVPLGPLYLHGLFG